MTHPEAKIFLRPLHDLVLVQKMEGDERLSQKGIILPGATSKKSVVRGRVIAAGPGLLEPTGGRLPMSVKEGDTVLFQKNHAKDLGHDPLRRDLYVLRDADIFFVEE